MAKNSKKIDDEIIVLNEICKSCSPAEKTKIQDVQNRLNELVSTTFKPNGPDDGLHYLYYEIMARIEYLQGNLKQADKYCDEAQRRYGAVYPDSVVLSNMIRSERKHLEKEPDQIITNTTENKNNVSAAGWIVAIILGIILLVVWSSNSGVNSSASDSSGDSNDLQGQLDDAQTCLRDSKDYIDTLESTIDDAAGAIDGDFEDLHEAVANLEHGTSPTCLSDY